MSFMNFGQKNLTIKPVPRKYKNETITVPRPTLPSRPSNNNSQTRVPATRVDEARGRLAVSNPPTRAGNKRKEREISGSRGVRKSPNPKTQKNPSQRPLESDSEEDEEIIMPAKRARSENMEPDLKRSLRDLKAFLTEADDNQGSKCKMIHAADVMMTKRRAKRGEKVCDRKEEGDAVFLRYPSVSRKERYQLISEGNVIDPGEEELINPYDEIPKIVEIVKDDYLTEEQAGPFQHPETGIIRKINKATNNITWTLANKHKKPYDKEKLKGLLLEFRNAVGAYNEALSTLTKNGSLAKNLDNKHSLSSKLLKMVLQQVYDRAVSPQVELTGEYKNGTNNVYGELTFPFISRILKEDTRMKSDQVFIDLGSGVGNVVVHAALQVGCESWGCEIMTNCCKLASVQKTEFFARCRAWGLSAGSVNLEEGDFRKNTKIHEAMKRADVILVNNQVFDPSLNDSLVRLFLDLKDGCKIVSLKTFVPDGYVMNLRNQDNPINVLLQVEKKTFAQGDVSWQGGGGNYYVATKDSSIVANYHKSLEMRKTRRNRAI
ncbi:Nucleosomal histone H3-Lys79 methylase [Ciborinia camelliae]|nr:Nucleosomal histone H3-Lys79 methylase [Ciborinia camelliae]